MSHPTSLPATSHEETSPSRPHTLHPRVTLPAQRPHTSHYLLLPATFPSDSLSCALLARLAARLQLLGFFTSPRQSIKNTFLIPHTYFGPRVVNKGHECRQAGDSDAEFDASHQRGVRGTAAADAAAEHHSRGSICPRRRGSEPQRPGHPATLASLRSTATGPNPVHRPLRSTALAPHDEHPAVLLIPPFLFLQIRVVARTCAITHRESSHEILLVLISLSCFKNSSHQTSSLFFFHKYGTRQRQDAHSTIFWKSFSPFFSVACLLPHQSYHLVHFSVAFLLPHQSLLNYAIIQSINSINKPVIKSFTSHTSSTFQNQFSQLRFCRCVFVEHLFLVLFPSLSLFISVEISQYMIILLQSEENTDQVFFIVSFSQIPESIPPTAFLQVCVCVLQSGKLTPLLPSKSLTRGDHLWHLPDMCHCRGFSLVLVVSVLNFGDASLKIMMSSSFRKNNYRTIKISNCNISDSLNFLTQYEKKGAWINNSPELEVRIPDLHFGCCCWNCDVSQMVPLNLISLLNLLCFPFLSFLPCLFSFRPALFLSTICSCPCLVRLLNISSLSLLCSQLISQSPSSVLLSFLNQNLHLNPKFHILLFSTEFVVLFLFPCFYRNQLFQSSNPLVVSPFPSASDSHLGVGCCTRRKKKYSHAGVRNKIPTNTGSQELCNAKLTKQQSTIPKPPKIAVIMLSLSNEKYLFCSIFNYSVEQGYQNIMAVFTNSFYANDNK
ncbi:hypothetical protein VP01_973g1 [Puccinia sorghi]|uniref:Uncharacterized protein n=1 Tax=Puccinia sorghi TaxID=27349 RepID=A0A0L6U5W1_9BASI|nr:hypothetical protein VP01_973g1 [Puccinia sorghi]